MTEYDSTSVADANTKDSAADNRALTSRFARSLCWCQPQTAATMQLESGRKVAT
jgi:hypothetical protein